MLSFLAYFIALIIAVGGVLFGVDVVIAPLPEQKSDVPLISVTSAPNKLAKREAERAEHDAAANKTLTPVYPANPGGVGAVTASRPAPSETTGIVASPDKATETIPSGGNTGGKCDIEVCNRVYRSFRASDCSYQPFGGPRRACVAPRATQTRSEPTSETLSRLVSLSLQTKQA